MFNGYNFDEIYLMPNWLIYSGDVKIEWGIKDKIFNIPIIASSDSVSDVAFATQMDKFGGLAVIDLEGISTRYEEPEEVIKVINKNNIVEIYNKPIREDLITKRIIEIKQQNAVAAVCCKPINAEHFAYIAKEAGVDLFITQYPLISANFSSKDSKVFDLNNVKKILGEVPFIVGNCATYQVALDLLKIGVDALIVGVGSGRTNNISNILGINVPQASATMEVSNARYKFFERTGKYVPIITDGGIANSGDICKAIACGADAVMLSFLLSHAKEAAGKGKYWGTSVFDNGLIKDISNIKTLETILYGHPNVVDEGLTNLIGSLKKSMGLCGANSIKEMHSTEKIFN